MLSLFAQINNHFSHVFSPAFLLRSHLFFRCYCISAIAVFSCIYSSWLTSSSVLTASSRALCVTTFFTIGLSPCSASLHRKSPQLVFWEPNLSLRNVFCEWLVARKKDLLLNLCCSTSEVLSRKRKTWGRDAVTI